MFPRFTFSAYDDIIARTRWYIHFRWFYIFTLAVPAGLSIYLSRGWSGTLAGLLLSATLIFITNGIFYALSRAFSQPMSFQIIAATILLTDILINSYLILTGGGVESRSVILYVVPIIMSAVIFGRKGIYSTVALVLIFYNSIVLADYFNVFRSESSFGPVFNIDFAYALYTVIFFSSALIASSIATDFILKLLRQKERQALENIEDLKVAQAIGKFGSWEWDKSKNEIALSDEMYRLLGLSKDSGNLSLEYFTSFIYPKDRQRFVAETTKASKKPRLFSFDYRLVTTDGALRFVRSEGQSLTGRSGHVETIIGTARDITEDRLLDQSKSEFVSLTSHQLRTPATVIKQYLSMLLDGYAGELTDKQRMYLKIASDTNEHQINIVNTLLGVAQLESGKVRLRMTQVDLVSLLKTLVEEYSPRASLKDQTISFSTRYKRAPCQADEHGIRTVFENILDNAFKYSMPGKAIRLRLTRESKSFLVSITDQGVGISNQDMSKLFKKFSRIENTKTFQEDGAGLGLYWAEKIITLHGGKIEVQSELGRGTTFKTLLPLPHAHTRRRKVRSRSRSSDKLASPLNRAYDTSA